MCISLPSITSWNGFYHFTLTDLTAAGIVGTLIALCIASVATVAVMSEFYCCSYEYDYHLFVLTYSNSPYYQH